MKCYEKFSVLKTYPQILEAAKLYATIYLKMQPVSFFFYNFKLLKIKLQNSSLPQNLFVPLHKIVSVQHKTEEPITGLPAGVSLPCVYTANSLWWLFGSDCDIWFVFIVLTQNKRLHSKHTVAPISHLKFR